MEISPRDNFPDEITLDLGPSILSGPPEELETPSMRPENDHGGPTSSYRGRIGDIGQQIVVSGNILHGRPAYEGIEDILPEDRIIKP